MKSKHFLRSALAILLVLCTLFSLCGILSACGKDDEEIVPPEEDGTSAENQLLTTCYHTTTALRNVRETSCARAGYTGDIVCTACGAIVQAGESIPALEHTWDGGQVTRNATCITPGIKTYTCYGCSTTRAEALGTVEHQEAYHDTLDGSTHNLTCASCTMNEYSEHVPTDDGTYHAASCTEPAYTEYVCELCEATYRLWSEAELASGHDWSAWTVDSAATCVQEGSKSHTCLSCGDKETVIIEVSANAHNYVEIAASRIKATCVSTGIMFYECTNEGCEHTTTRTIAINANAHNLSTPVTDGAWTRQECLNAGCDHVVSTYNVTEGTEATVNATAIDSDRTFEVSTGDASLQFPTSIVSQMKTAEDAEVKVNAGVASDKAGIIEKATNLAPEEKARLESEDIDIFDFSVTVNGAPLDFSATGTVTVTIPYTLGEDEDPNGIQIWHVSEDGTITAYTNVVYVDGFVTFEAEHFSYYAVAYEETQEMKCKRGIHDWMENPMVAEATCERYGYTIKECSTCHTRDVEITHDKLEHSWGDFIYPKVTCTEGGYVTKECGKCGAIKTFSYQRAPGHDLDHTATCTEPSTCKTCNSVVMLAKGHSWGDWQTVFEPTATKSGLRRRCCLSCGAMEDVKLASATQIEEVSFDSYEELFETMLEEMLGFQNGTMTFEIDVEDEGTCTMTFTIEQEGESYVVLMDYEFVGTSKRYENGGYVTYEYTDTVQALYRNGVTVTLYSYISPYSTYGNEIEAWGSLETLFEIPYAIALNYAKQGFDYYAPGIEASFEDVAATLRIFDALCGDAINDVLKEIGSGYTLCSLAELFDKCETVYTYLALKLGFPSTNDLPQDVVIPTTKDFLEVLDGFMTTTPNAVGGLDYILDPDELLTTINAILDWIEAHENVALSELIYDLVGDEIEKYYPTVNSWSSFEQKIRTTFPGTMKIKDAMDTVISMLKDKNICTLEQLYSICDSLFYNLYGVEFDTEAYVAENGDSTLNDLADELDGCTMTELYDEISESLCNNTLAELVLDSEWRYDSGTEEYVKVDETTFAEWIDEIRAGLNCSVVTGELFFSLDAEGRLLALDVDHKLDYSEEGAETVTIESIRAVIARDDDVAVEIPAEFETVLNNAEVTAHFDEDGNMILTVPEGYEFELSVGGSGRVPFESLLEYDRTLSEELGYEVYVLKQQYWTRTHDVGNYILYNGEYYERLYRSSYTSSYENVVKELALESFIANPALILPASDATPAGYCWIDGEEIDVYDSMIGKLIYQVNGVWYIAKGYRTSSSVTQWDDETNRYVSRYIYSISSSVAFDAAMASVQVSNFSSYSTNAKRNGESISLMRVYLSLDATAWGSDTVPALVYLNENNELSLVDTEYVSSYSTSWYELGNKVTALPAYDTIEQYYSSYYKVLDAAGNDVSSLIQFCELGRLLPAYYLKVGDGAYTALESSYNEYMDSFTYSLSQGFATAVDLTNAKSFKLPDGNTLYVLGEKNTIGTRDAGSYDRILYGYSKVQDGLYIKTACYYDGSKLIEVVHYQTNSTTYMSYSNYMDIASYMMQTSATTYFISAELFTAMNKLCGAGDSYWINVCGTKTVGDMAYEFTSVQGLYMVPENMDFSYNYYSTYVDWYSLFNGTSDMRSLFSVTSAGNGTVSVRYGTGEALSISYSANNSYPIGNLIPLDTAKSQETGLRIHSAAGSSVYDNYYKNLVYRNGSYYFYSTYSADEYTYTDLSYFKSKIANDWSLCSLYYRYNCTYNNGSADVIIPVYEASFSFGFGQNVIMFVTLQNGKLNILTGAVEQGSSVLKFEDMVPASEYFAAVSETLTLTENSYSSSYTVYVDGELVNRRSQYATFVDTDDLNVILQSYTVYIPCVVVNGTVKYIESSTSVGSYLELGAQVTDMTGYVMTGYSSSSSYVNGTFMTTEFLYTYPGSTNYYVKLAGSFYYYNSYAFISESDFLSCMADADWYYAIYDDATGKWKCYNKISYKDGYAVLSEYMVNAITLSGASGSVIGTTANGDTVYEICGYVLSNIETLYQSDGTVFYHRQGETGGYLKAQNGQYVSACMIENGDGTYTVNCTGLSEATISDNALNASGAFDRYVTFGGNGSVITISKSILTAIPEETRNSFSMTIRCYGDYGHDSFTWDYEDLVSWFALTETCFY